MTITDLEYFQDIQNAYSTLTNLQVIITDKSGNQITQLSNNTNIFDLVCNDSDDAKTIFGKITRNYPKINELILYESLPGVKIIVCPIYLEEIEYFIFAGCLIDYSSKQTVQTYLNKLLNDPKKVNLILSLTQEYTQNQIKDLMKKINKMAEILTGWVQVQQIKTDLKNRNTIQDEFFQLLKDDDVTIKDLLQRFVEKNSKVDFIGYARRISPVHFEIKECLSLGGELKGTVFLIGEGILGQVAALNTGKFWSEIEWDPRTVFFHQRGIFPKSIFCFPVSRGQEIIGLFFGGSSKFVNLEKEVSMEGKLTTMLITLFENKMYWKRQAITYHERTKVFNDIFQSMASFKEEKSIQLFLLDSSTNLIFSHFVMVILLQKSNDSIDIVSRGLTIENVNEYKNDVLYRYFQNNGVEQTNLEPNILFSKRGDRFLEIPICHQNNLYGWLCIGLNDEIEGNHLSLLKILANAGGLAIHMLKSSYTKEIDGNMIDSFVKLLEFNDPEHLRKASKAREILKGFGTYSSDPRINMNALKLSCYLTVYSDESFIKGLENESVIAILREYILVDHNLLPLSDASLNVQLLVLVWTYLNKEEDINSLINLTGFNNELLKNFTLFISDIYNKTNENVQNLVSFTESKNLTKRENEVLKLVLEGKNNREIADILYISGHTVKNHITNIFQKLDVNDRSQVFAKIYQIGFKPQDVS